MRSFAGAFGQIASGVNELIKETSMDIFPMDILGWFKAHRRIAIVAFVAIGLFFVLTAQWPVPDGTKIVKHVMNRAGVKACSLDRVRASLLGGLTLDKLSTTVPLDGDVDIKGTFPSLHLTFNSIGLFLHSGTIASLLFDSTSRKHVAEIDDETTPKPRESMSSFSRILKHLSPILDQASSMKFANAKIVVSGIAPWPLTANRAEANLDLELDDRFDVKGTFKAASLGVDKMRAENVSMKISSKDSILVIGDVKAKFFCGRIGGNTSLDIAGMKLGATSVSVADMNVENLYRATGLGGIMKGEANAELRLVPSKPEFSALAGTVSVGLKRVYASELPVIKNLFLLGALSGLKSMTFNEFKANGRISKGTVLVDTIHCKGDPLQLDAAGKLHPADGSFSFALNCVFDTAYQENVTPLVWGSLNTEPDGRKSAKGVLSGTFVNPTFDMDHNMTMRAVRNIFHRDDDGSPSERSSRSGSGAKKRGTVGSIFD